MRLSTAHSKGGQEKTTGEGGTNKNSAVRRETKGGVSQTVRLREIGKECEQGARLMHTPHKGGSNQEKDRKRALRHRDVGRRGARKDYSGKVQISMFQHRDPERRGIRITVETKTNKTAIL